LEDEHTRDDEVREMATDTMATSTTELNYSTISIFARSLLSCFVKNAPRFASLRSVQQRERAEQPDEADQRRHCREAGERALMKTSMRASEQQAKRASRN
jgi:hypothetical protein